MNKKVIMSSMYGNKGVVVSILRDSGKTSLKRKPLDKIRKKVDYDDVIGRASLVHDNINQAVIMKIVSMIKDVPRLKVYNLDNGEHKISCPDDEDFHIKFDTKSRSFLINIYCMGNHLVDEYIPVYVNESRYIKELDLALGLKLIHWEW